MLRVAWRRDALDQSGRNRVGSDREHDRHLFGGVLGGASHGRRDRHDDVDLIVALQVARRRLGCRGVAPFAVPNEEREMPALFKPGRPQPVAQRLDRRLEGAATINDANASDASLSAGGTPWPNAGGYGRENRDDVPPSHSITSSARARSVGGTATPTARAV